MGHAGAERTFRDVMAAEVLAEPATPPTPLRTHVSSALPGPN